MTKEEKYNIAKWAMEHALKNGANDASVSITNSNASRVEVREEKIDKLEEANRSSMSIRLYVNNKYSSIATNRLSNKKELGKFIEEAIAGTKYLAEDKFRSLPDSNLYFKGEEIDLKISDKDFRSLDPKQKIDKAFLVEKQVFGTNDKILSVSSSYRDSLYETVMVNSKGFQGDTQNSYFSLYASVSIKDGDARPGGGWSESSIFSKDLKLEGIGDKALKRALDKIGQKKIKSETMPMIIENRLTGQTLSPLLSALKGSSIQQKDSFLIGMKNEKIGSELMDFIDDPHIISGRGSKLFDNEGLATKKRSIVEKGILKNYFIDSYYAKKLDMEPTSGSTSNLILKPGEKSLEELLQDIDRGILVTGFKGGNSNGSSGDFSYGIEGVLVENGKIIHPIAEMNITGNFKELWNNLAAVGSDVHTSSSWLLPSVVFDKVSFSGI